MFPYWYINFEITQQSPVSGVTQFVNGHIQTNQNESLIVSSFWLDKNMLVLNQIDFSFKVSSVLGLLVGLLLKPRSFNFFIGWPGVAGEQGALRPDFSPVYAGPERRHHGDQRLDSLPAQRNHNKDRGERDRSQHRGHQHARNVQAQWCMWSAMF